MSFSLNIVAGSDAFGDGLHPTTRGAITALEAMANLQGITSVLDMGCGSGILALQAAYQWHTPVLAADIEQSAIDATTQNATANQLETLVHAIRSDGYRHADIRAHAPFDVIISNILAEQLVSLAYDLGSHLADEGVAILSGILAWQSDTVIQAHQAQGLRLSQRIVVGDWVTLLMQKIEPFES